MKNHLGFEENCRRRIKRGHKNFKGKNQLNECVFCVCVELESPARRPPPPVAGSAERRGRSKRRGSSTVW